MQPYPRSPALVWPGHLHGTGCSSVRAVGTGFPTVVRRLCLGPVGGWVWVLLTPRLGWVCLGTVCGVVPLVSAVCGVRGWGSVSACFWDVCGCLGAPLAPLPFPVPACGVGVCAGPGSRLCPALLGWVVGVCFLCFFFSFFWVFPSWALWSLSPHPLSFGLGCWLSLFFFFLFRCPFSRWAAVPCLVLPVWAGWSPCATLGVLSLVPSGGGVWPPLVVLAGDLAAVGCFCAFSPYPLRFSFFGGGACLFLPLPSLGWCTHWPAFSVVFRAAVLSCVLFGRVRAPWVGCSMYTVGSAPLLAGLRPGSAGWAAAPGGCLWFWVRGLGLFVSLPLCGAGFNLLGGPPPLLPGAPWPRVWPAVLVCGVLVRRLSGCAVAGFG